MENAGISRQKGRKCTTFATANYTLLRNTQVPTYFIKTDKTQKNRNKLDATEIETQIENDILTKSTHWVFFYSVNQSINQSDLPKSIGSRVKRGGRQKQIVDVLMLLI